MRDSIRPAHTLRGHASAVYSLTFLDNSGQHLATGSWDGTTCLWDLATGRIASSIERYSSGVLSMVVSQRSHWLTIGSADHQIRLWRVNRWLRAALHRALAIHAGAVYSVIYSADERWLISGGTDRAVHILDVQHPERTPLALRTHDGHVYQVALSPSGRWLASASMDNTMALWDMHAVTTGMSDRPMVVLRGHTDGVTSVLFSHDGRKLFSGSYDRTIRCWDLSLLPHDLTTLRYAVPITLRGHTDNVQCLALSPNGSLLASASSDHTIRLWRVATRRPLCVAALRQHDDAVYIVGFSPDGSLLASGSKDHTAMVWDLRKMAPPPQPLKR